MKAIKTSYLGPTDRRGGRIKATDCDRNSLVVPYQYDLNDDENHKVAATLLCEEMKWKGKTIMGSFPLFNVHVFVKEETQDKDRDFLND